MQEPDRTLAHVVFDPFQAQEILEANGLLTHYQVPLSDSQGNVFMMAKAMEEVGSVTDLKAIAAKIKSMRYDGVRLMRYDNDGRANSDIDIGILKDGKISSVRASPE